MIFSAFAAPAPNILLESVEYDSSKIIAQQIARRTPITRKIITEASETATAEIIDVAVVAVVAGKCTAWEGAGAEA